MSMWPFMSGSTPVDPNDPNPFKKHAIVGRLFAAKEITVGKQFKALHKFYKDCSGLAERREFNSLHWSRAFQICRSALEEFTRGPRRDNQDVGPCLQVIEDMTKLVQDIPDKLVRGWQANNFSELLERFLDYEAHEDIRLKAVLFGFGLVNGCKGASNIMFIQHMTNSIDFRPFCEGRYSRYFNYFSERAIKAQEPLPWKRTVASKQHSLDILERLLMLLRQTHDFEWWYSDFVVPNIYPQLYSVTDDEKGEVESGFGTESPPAPIQGRIAEWVCNLLRFNERLPIICRDHHHLDFLMCIFKHTFVLDASQGLVIRHVIQQHQQWVLGFSVPAAMTEKFQHYLQVMISNMFPVIYMDVRQNPRHKKIKLHLCSYVILVYRLISAQPYQDLDGESWSTLITTLLTAANFMIGQVTDSPDTETLEFVIRPLLRCLMRAYLECSISKPEVANDMWTALEDKVPQWLHWKTFVEEWKHAVVDLSIELLFIMTPDMKRDAKNGHYRNSRGTMSRPTSSSPSPEMKRGDGLDESVSFEGDILDVDVRIEEYGLNVLEFDDNLDQAFMVWDRLAHCLGRIVDNPHQVAREIQLEGITESLAVLVAPLRKRVRRKAKDDILNGGKKKLKMIEVLPGKSHLLPLPPRHLLPQGSTLVRIYGPFFFDTCNQILNQTITEQISRVREFSMAFDGLCSIFLEHCVQPSFSEIQLAEFYRVIRKSLNNSTTSQTIGQVVLKGCANNCIFGKNLSGINVIIPDLIKMIRQITGLEGKQRSNMNPRPLNEELITDCLKVCHSMISFPAYFDAVMIAGPEGSPISLVKDTLVDLFSSVLSHIQSVNVRAGDMALSGMCVLVFDELSSSRNTKLLQTMLRSIVASTNHVLNHIAFTAINVIRCLSEVGSDLFELDRKLLTSILFPAFLNNCQMAINAVKESSNDITRFQQASHVAVDMLYCLLEWFLQMPNYLLTNNDITTQYFGLLYHILNSVNSQSIDFQNREKFQPLIRNLHLAVRSTYIQLLNYMNNIPLEGAYQRIVSNVRDVPVENGTPENFIYLVYDNNPLITGQDNPIHLNIENSNKPVRLTFRDESGKYTFDFGPCQIPARPLKLREPATRSLAQLENGRKATVEMDPPDDDLETDHLDEFLAEIPQFRIDTDIERDCLHQVSEYARQYLQIKSQKSGHRRIRSGIRQDGDQKTAERDQLERDLEQQQMDEEEAYHEKRMLDERKMNGLVERAQESARIPWSSDPSVLVQPVRTHEQLLTPPIPAQAALNHYTAVHVTPFDRVRYLMSHLGILTAHNVLDTPYNDEMLRVLVDGSRLHRSLRLLDTQSQSRERHKIGLVYVGPGQDDQRYILGNSGGSPAYERFVNSIGWQVDLTTHQGFNGGLEASTTGRYSTYFSTATYEMMFHVVTRMTTKADDHRHVNKKRHVGNDHVNIVWSDHTRDFITETVSSDFNHVHIVIYPLQNGLYRVCCHKKAGVGAFNPLCTHMIVREHVLAPLVRLTALCANRTVRYATPGYDRPYPERRKYIDETISKQSSKVPEHILEKFFPGVTAS